MPTNCAYMWIQMATISEMGNIPTKISHTTQLLQTP